MRINYNFKLPDFPTSNFEIKTSIWIGKSKLFKDGSAIEQSTEKGKPFLIPTANGEILRAFPKTIFPDVIPTLEINGTKHFVAKKLY